MPRLPELGQESVQEQQDELLSAYLDGQLSAEEQTRLIAQLEDDPALQTELETMRRTVEMVRDLPSVPVPRNFILPQSMGAPARPKQLARRPVLARLAPFLTASTAVVSLLFVVLLVGDLLFVGGMRMSTAPMAEAPLMLEQEAAEEDAAPLTGYGEGEFTVTAAAEAEAQSEPAPLPLIIPTASDESQEYDAGGTPEGVIADPEKTTAGGNPTGEPGTPTPVPSPVAPPLSGEDLGATGLPTSPPMNGTMPDPDESTELSPRLDEELAPPDVTPYREGREVLETAPAGIPSWRMWEIGLGLLSLVFALATVWAWRLRQR